MNECKYKDGRTLGDREIAHIMIALLMAGQHTSSATSSWTLLHLASRPDVWYGLFCEIWPTKNSLFASSRQQLWEEQVSHFKTSDGTLREIEYEDIRDLPVLDSVIRETLRVHPPIHSILVSCPSLASCLRCTMLRTRLRFSAMSKMTFRSHRNSPILPLQRKPPGHMSFLKAILSSLPPPYPRWTRGSGRTHLNGNRAGGQIPRVWRSRR